MNKQCFLSAFALLTFFSVVAEGKKEVRFPEFSELPKALVMPKNAIVSVAKDGTYLINGKPTFLITVKMAEGDPYNDLQPTSGYPASLKWLYEAPLTYENAVRLGFNSIGVCASREWVWKSVGEKRKSRDQRYEIFFRAGLPVHQDMGGFTPWGPGLIANRKSFREKFDPDAFNRYDNRHGNHWVPYSVNHPQGRGFYFSHWNNGIDESQRKGGRAFRYELFNEPAYNDPSPYNRKRFVKFLKEKYGTVAAMNKIWKSEYPSFEAASQFKAQGDCAGLFVDWCKFMEKSFAELCRDGAELVKKRVPNALVCVQTMGGGTFRFLPNSNINLLEINRHMNSISTPTGGGVSLAGLSSETESTISTPDTSWVGLNDLAVKFCLAMADGKPVHDDETYFGKKGPASLYLELMRGIGNSSIFEWGKRGYEWKTEEQGRKSAERFPWYILNPYSYPTEKFLTILETQKKIQAISEFFVPRTRGISRPLAVMISFPTERMAGFTGNLSSEYSSTVSNALLFAHHAYDAICEEQLTEGRADRYRVIFAPGIKNTYVETNPILERWVRSGGILVGLLDTMEFDEYGHPVKTLFDFKSEKADPASSIEWNFKRHPDIPGALSGYPVRRITSSPGWEKLGSVMLRKKLGKGWIYFIGARLPDYSLAAVFGGILQEHGIGPQCKIVKAENPAELAPGIEAAAAEQDGIYALMLLNHDKYPKLVRVTPPDGKFFGAAADAFRKELLPKGRDNSCLIPLAPEECFAVCFTLEKETLAKKFGPLAPVSEPVLRKRFAEMPRPKAAKGAADFNADPADLKTLDLRQVVNRHFVDGPACDGKGGWTDQGPSTSLEGVPFGMQTFRNIPCDVIRWDMNGNRACLVMDSKNLLPGFGAKRSGNIPVMEKVKALYFFHTSAWTRGGEHMMSYILHCRSGKKMEIPVIGNKNIADWYHVISNPLKSEIAWKNLSGNGFYCIRWENPHPEEFVESITAESKSGNSIPIVIGITAEKFSTPAARIPFPADIETVPWGKLSAPIRNGRIDVLLSENTRNWAGIRIQRKFLKPFELLPSKKVYLTFEVCTGKDLFGKTGQFPVLHVNLNQCGYMAIPGMKSPAVNSGDWHRIRVPLEHWKKYRPGDPIVSISFQYQNAAYTGFSLRRFALEGM